MALTIDKLDLPPSDNGGAAEVRAALEAAAAVCATGVSWKVSVYENANMEGTEVVLEGPRVSQVEAEWWEELPGRYVMIMQRDGEWVRALCTSVARVIRQSS
jgi:hypothetical protein